MSPSISASAISACRAAAALPTACLLRVIDRDPSTMARARDQLVRTLRLAVWRDMADQVESAERRTAREVRFADDHATVEPPPDLARERETAQRRAHLLVLAADDTERRGIELWLDDASTVRSGAPTPEG